MPLLHEFQQLIALRHAAAGTAPRLVPVSVGQATR